MKRILSLILLLITLSLPLAACSKADMYEFNKAVYDVGEDIYDMVKPEIEKEHDEWVSFMEHQCLYPSYSSLFAKHDQFMSHVAMHDCSHSKENYYYLLLLGTWKDSNGKYIRLSYKYTNYDNTYGEHRFSTNLSTSQTYNNDYYFYFESTYNNGNKLIIGYQNKETDQKIENFRVSFYSDHILLYSFIENKTYTLMRDPDNNGMVKGYAKRAYDWISSFVSYIHSADNGVSNFEAEWCYVTDESVYCSLSWRDGEGTLVKGKYRFYKENGSLMYETTTYTYDSNINITELNNKLLNYLSSLKASK